MIYRIKIKYNDVDYKEHDNKYHFIAGDSKEEVIDFVEGFKGDVKVVSIKEIKVEDMIKFK